MSRLTYQKVKAAFKAIGFVVERSGGKYQVWSNECDQGCLSECDTLSEVLSLYGQSKREYIAERIAALQIGHGLTDDDLDRVIKRMREKMGWGYYPHLEKESVRRQAECKCGICDTCWPHRVKHLVIDDTLA